MGPITPPAVDAWRSFVEAGLLGKSWSPSSMWKSWHTAIATARATAEAHAARTGDTLWVAALDALPRDAGRPDLRHSFASEVYRQTGDLRAVAQLLQHANLETTRRYTQGAVSDRVDAAIATATAASPTIPTLPAPEAPPPVAPRLVSPTS